MTVTGEDYEARELPPGTGDSAGESATADGLQDAGANAGTCHPSGRVTRAREAASVLARCVAARLRSRRGAAEPQATDPEPDSGDRVEPVRQAAGAKGLPPLLTWQPWSLGQHRDYIKADTYYSGRGWKRWVEVAYDGVHWAAFGLRAVLKFAEWCLEAPFARGVPAAVVVMVVAGLFNGGS
jgi:hypothetical protein